MHPAQIVRPQILLVSPDSVYENCPSDLSTRHRWSVGRPAGQVHRTDSNLFSFPPVPAAPNTRCVGSWSDPAPPVGEDTPGVLTSIAPALCWWNMGKASAGGSRGGVGPSPHSYFDFSRRELGNFPGHLRFEILERRRLEFLQALRVFS